MEEVHTRVVYTICVLVNLYGQYHIQMIKILIVECLPQGIKQIDWLHKF